MLIKIKESNLQRIISLFQSLKYYRKRETISLIRYRFLQSRVEARGSKYECVCTIKKLTWSASLIRYTDPCVLASFRRKEDGCGYIALSPIFLRYSISVCRLISFAQSCFSRLLDTLGVPLVKLAPLQTDSIELIYSPLRY